MKSSWIARRLFIAVSSSFTSFRGGVSNRIQGGWAVSLSHRSLQKEEGEEEEEEEEAEEEEEKKGHAPSVLLCVSSPFASSSSSAATS